MFRGFAVFMPAQEDGQRPATPGARGLGWFLMASGLGLMCAPLAMIIWPALLAYFVASLLLCGGTVLLMVGWRMRHLAPPTRRPMASVPPLDLR